MHHFPFAIAEGIHRGAASVKHLQKFVIVSRIYPAWIEKERERERERREDRESIRKIKRATAKEKSSIADRDIDIADENGPPLSQHVNVISIQHADRHAVYLATRTLSH